MRGKRLSAVAATALAISASSSVALGQEPPTRPEYVAQAEKVCKASKERTDPILKGVGADIKHNRLEPAGRALSRAARLFGAQRQKLVGIPRPPEDVRVLTVWLGRLDTEHTLMAKAGSLLLEGRRGKVTAYLARYAHAGNLANDTVLGYGFHECLFRLTKLPKA